jgi:cytochrome c oxidase subunit 4
MGHSSGTDIHGELGHVLPLKTYKTVLGALLILTIITVAVSRVDFGTMNLVVAMVVASIKAVLVALFFMHLKYESPITWLYAGIPVFLLGLLIGGVFIDDPLRIDPKNVTVSMAEKVSARAPATDHGVDRHGANHH